MENANGHGGARKGSGRKKKEELLVIRQLLDENIDYKFVVEKLRDLIDSGDYRAIQLYLNYRFGNPIKSMEVMMDSVQDLKFNLQDILKFKDK
ncbi:MAG: hypothetical protein HOM76_00050 [Flavobacteriaceae bacterium]|nr:hypothetical protein [Flavobacteriaceae bacterium]MBT5284219.1 hypothetical protein [Flavobacteriaceae bacterium]MBT5446201.1 hypothetical protein [Flavobacteriaceae bacterium]MDC0001392.1 hypothetical protein [Flavobacteriaceae bacterium]MDG1140510.1 hypothetical protein [Flavobacteriaceae bacterium]